MFVYDTDTLRDGKVYRSTDAYLPEDEEPVIEFLQPLEDLQEAQKAHDEALRYLLEQEEDIIVRKASLEYPEGA